MSFEKPLYQPCVAAHSPQRLERLVATEISKILIFNSIPAELKPHDVYSFTPANATFNSTLDKVLLGITGYTKYFDLTVKRFQLMKDWWEKDDWFGRVGSPIRSLIQDSVSYLLDNMDYYSNYPLFRFTCQLCYTKEAGVFDQHTSEVTVQVPKRFCDTYSTFLEFLGLFQVQRLQNTSMVFGSPAPLVTIIRNVPHLKLIHLRYNSSDYILTHVSHFCDKLETIIIQDFFGKLTVSEAYLYKSFFGGLEKHELRAKTRSAPASVQLSFPRLSRLDVGNSLITQDFFCFISAFYPRLKSLSCFSSNLGAMCLLRASAYISDKFVPFSIEDICLTSDCLINLDENVFTKFFPRIKHVTLAIYSVPSNQLDTYKQKVTAFMTKSDVRSVSLHLPFESLPEQDLYDTLAALFTLIGPRVTCLQFFSWKNLETCLLWDAVNKCPNLELLSFQFDIYSSLKPSFRVASKLIALSRLKSFSVAFHGTDNLDFFLERMEDIIEKAPNVEALELMIPCVGSTWIKNVAARGILKHVELLVMFMHSPLLVPLDIDFYVVVLEALTALERLVLMGVPAEVLSHMKSVFSTSRLAVIPGKKRSWVSYDGIHSKRTLYAGT